MDPANDALPYPCAVDIRDFITLEEIMQEQQLGPNGGLMYAVESLDNSIDLFILQIKSLVEEEKHILYSTVRAKWSYLLITHLCSTSLKKWKRNWTLGFVL